MKKKRDAATVATKGGEKGQESDQKVISLVVFRLFVTAKPNNTSMNHNKLPFVSFIFITSLVLVFLFSCKEKEPVDPNTNCTTCHSVLEAKDYFAFKEGSYWVYEEETTHERDSMYVTQSWIGADYDFNVTIKSQLTDFEYRYWPIYYPNAGSCSKTSNVSGRCLYVNFVKAKPLMHLGQTIVFFLNFKLGDFAYTGDGLDNCQNNKIHVSEILLNFDLQSYHYTNVVRIDTDCEHAEGDQPTRKYYAKGVGIIRKELIDSNQVWNLVKYKIAL